MNRLDLSEQRVDLWLTSVATITDIQIDQYRGLLTDDERRRERRFYFERDRRRYVVTRALVRTTLSRYGETTPNDWRFVDNAFGRPEIANDGVTERAISFNISHAADLVLVGVTRHASLGVDLEHANRATETLELAERFFSPAEVAELKPQPAALRDTRFFEYWTLKESYIKARGRGLSIALDSFSFTLDTDGHIGFSVRQDADDPLAAGWRFWQWCPCSGYVAAVCLQAGSSGNRQLLLRRVVPLASEELVDCNIRRQSHDGEREPPATPI